jgi:hypothetical protein
MVAFMYKRILFPDAFSLSVPPKNLLLSKRVVILSDRTLSET